jgi:hypothetical protein
MKNKLLTIVAVCIFALSKLVFPSNQVWAEDINSYDASIDIVQDGSILVNESIRYDFGSLDKHGIYRNIPTIKTNSEGKKYKLTMENFTVTDENGSPYQYNLSQTSDMASLKIGDPNRMITGIHTYKIKYQVKGAVTYFSDHDELYWNITGTTGKYRFNP